MFWGFHSDFGTQKNHATTTIRPVLHFDRRLSVSLSVRLSLCLSGSHTLLVVMHSYVLHACIPRNAATICFIFIALIQCFLINMFMLFSSAYAVSVCLLITLHLYEFKRYRTYYGNRCPNKIDVLQWEMLLHLLMTMHLEERKLIIKRRSPFASYQGANEKVHSLRSIPELRHKNERNLGMMLQKINSFFSLLNDVI